MFLFGLKINPFAELPEQYSTDIKVRKAKKSDMPAVEEMVALLFPDADMNREKDDIYLVAEDKFQRNLSAFKLRSNVLFAEAKSIRHSAERCADLQYKKIEGASVSKIVGFCHYRLREENCYIVGLGVLPEFRKHGIGSLLMANILCLADKKGILTTTLKVRALNTAVNLYAKFGFFEKRSGNVLLLVRKRPS